MAKLKGETYAQRNTKNANCKLFPLKFNLKRVLYNYVRISSLTPHPSVPQITRTIPKTPVSVFPQCTVCRIFLLIHIFLCFSSFFSPKSFEPSSSTPFSLRCVGFPHPAYTPRPGYRTAIYLSQLESLVEATVRRTGHYRDPERRAASRETSHEDRRKKTIKRKRSLKMKHDVRQHVSKKIYEAVRTGMQRASVFALFS